LLITRYSDLFLFAHSKAIQMKEAKVSIFGKYFINQRNYWRNQNVSAKKIPAVTVVNRAAIRNCIVGK
jgi:hypothetical protein